MDVIRRTDILNDINNSSSLETIDFNANDMRKELHILLYGDNFGNKAYGQWVVLRIFDKTKYSRFWDPIKKESIGGPKWEWKDYLIRSRRYAWDLTTSTNKGIEAQIRQGLIQPFDYLYYVEYMEHPETGEHIEPTIDDCLYELVPEKSFYYGVPKVNTNDHTNKMNFVRCQPIYGDYGRIEYYLLVARKEEGGW